jgi:hypothetical protein
MYVCMYVCMYMQTRTHMLAYIYVLSLFPGIAYMHFHETTTFNTSDVGHMF